MGVCAMCHDGKKAPNACSTCHMKSADRGGSPSRIWRWSSTAALAKGREKRLPALPSRRCRLLREAAAVTRKGTFAKLTEEQRMQERFNSQ